MTASCVGYYVHHHGAGHAARFAHIASAYDGLLTPISEMRLAGGVELPSDVVGDDVDPTAGGALHWAPLGHERAARRSLIFGRWLAETRPRGVVVDVSVEAALLCRLFGIATIVVRQHGDRTDPPHEMAYRSARRLMAPFPEELEHRSTPGWIRRKTTYTGFISGPRRGRSCAPTRSPGDIPSTDDVVILWGAGGGELRRDDVIQIVGAASPNRVWFVGNEPFDTRPLGVTPLGWVSDVRSLLREQPSVIASAGNNVVADAATAGCALVCVPQARPFEEQLRHAESLDGAGMAVGIFDVEQPDWRRAMVVARERRPVLAALGERADGAAAAATLIDATF